MEFVVCGELYTVIGCHQMAARLCGSSINPAYFQLLDLPISEFIYHLRVFVSIQETPKGENTAESVGAWS